MNKQNNTLGSKSKKGPKYKYTRIKLAQTLAKLDRRKKQLELLQSEISFLEKRAENYSAKFS